MIDGHMHLEYGPLSKEYVMEFVHAAIQSGMDEIQILDHTHRFQEFEPIYEELKEIKEQKIWLENKAMKFKDSLKQYEVLIQEIKAMNLPIKVYFGLEVCYVPQHENTIKEILQPYHFDFLVGSIHSIDGCLYDMPFSPNILWEKKEVDEIYRRYYELLIQCVESDLFTQLAHPDTIKMFHYVPSYDLHDTYVKLAKALRAHHVKAENNTGCYYRYHHEDMGLSDELLAIFQQYGVNLITASDAHKPQHVGAHIRDIWKKTMQ